MILTNSSTDSYPFTAKSTRELNRSGLTLAPERVICAKLYPKVKKPTLIHISRLDKTKDYVKLDLDSAESEYVASIYFPLTNNCPFVKPQKISKYTVGYAIQDGELCGSVVGDELLVPVLKTIPVTEFSPSSFIFSPSVCFLQILDYEKSKRLLYDGKEVKKVVFDTAEIEPDTQTLVGDPEIGYTIDTDRAVHNDPIVTVKGLRINGETIGGEQEGKSIEDVYILAGKDSGIRVVTANGTITIGRLMDL